MLKLIAQWRREREIVRELSRLSDRDLADLGISRADIPSVAGGAVPRPADEASTMASQEAHDAMSPSWGAHNRRSLAA